MYSASIDLKNNFTVKEEGDIGLFITLGPKVLQ